MLPAMELLFSVLLVVILQLGGLFVLAHHHKKLTEQQNFSLRMLAMFRKAQDVNDVAAMAEILEDAEVKNARAIAERVKEKSKEPEFLPDELPVEALSEIRKQM
jgi:hypothetical protein